MQAGAALNAVKCCCGLIGRTVSGQTAKVSPDVWRELTFVVANAYSLVLPRRETIRPLADDGRTPIVLIHGLGGNRGTWWPLRLFLRLHGYRRVYAFGYEDGTVQELAAGLVEFIDEVREKTGREQVNIVAHSLGGIISRYAIQRLRQAEAVKTLITLASPHQGTYMANWANTTLTRALRADSDLIADLNTDDLSVLSVRLVTVRSDRDIYVLPHENMTHPDAENIFVPGLAHTQQILSKEVYRIILRCLTQQTEALAAG